MSTSFQNSIMNNDHNQSTRTVSPNTSGALPRVLSRSVVKSQQRAHELDTRERAQVEERGSGSAGLGNSLDLAASGFHGVLSSPTQHHHHHHHQNTNNFNNNNNNNNVGPSSTNHHQNNNNNNTNGNSSKPQQQRFIPVCHSEDSKEDKMKDKLETFIDNSISTSRYSLSPLKLNFIVWKNLWEQFHRRANWFFFFVGILELVPELESLSAVNLITLTVVLLLGMFRSLVEDLKRQAADRVMNSQSVMVIKNFGDKEWRTVRSMEVAVGDIVLLETSAKNAIEAIPCDLVLLSTSESDDTCAVQSAHIDGEAKWTMKRCLPATKIPTIDERQMMDGDELGEDFVRQVTNMFEGMTITCDKPDGHIHSFEGTMKMRSSLHDFPLKIPQLLLRGTQLRKAKWVVGVCVYTGNETKALMGHELPTRKWSRVENVVNALIFISLFFYLLVVIACTVVAAEISMKRNIWYLPDDKSKTRADEVAIMLFNFIIFFENAIPISLYVTLEIIELVAAFLIEEDLALYDSHLDRRTAVRAPELLPDLGQISYIFSDKTGTITRNELSLRKFAVRGEIYGTGITEIGRAVAKHRGEVKQQTQDRKRRQSAYVGLSPLSEESNNNNNNFNNINEKDLDIKERSRRRSSFATAQDMITDEVDAEMSPFYDPRFDEETWFRHVDGPYLEKLFTAMAVCHTANISLQYSKQRRKSKNVARLNRIKKYDGESPDECALCETARKFGVEFIERQGDSVIVENRNGSRIPYIIRDVLPFTSDRMRMSVLIELPNKTYKLICKGADTAIFPLAAKDDAFAMKESEAAGRLAAEGLRTLVFAERKLSKKFVEEWLRKDTAAKNAGDFYFGSVTNTRKNLASEIEKDLKIIGVTGMEDMLQHGVPETMKALRVANIKVWVVTGDSREAAINIGYSSGMVPIEAHLLELYGITKENIHEFKEQVENPIVPGADLASELAKSVSFSGVGKDPATGEGGGIVDGALKRASSLRAGQRRSTRQENQESPENQQQDEPLLAAASSYNVNSASNYVDDGKPKVFVAIIDGMTFATILEADEDFQLMAFKALEKCSSVLCSRFSSSQKAKIVAFMSKWNQKVNERSILSVGIGDGTNDIPMLRATSVGIGMFGVENFDAANAGDFAISQFWFLQRLLLNHGRSNYRRFSLVIKYFLYKNLFFVGMLFFFAVQSDFSPQSFISTRILALYNIVFTSVPIIVAGITDRDIFKTDDMTRSFPELYWDGHTNAHLNLRGLLPWIADAISHAIICYFICFRMYEPISSDGITMGGESSGLVMFTVVVVVANVHLGFHIASYTVLMLVSFWASVIFGYFWSVMLFSATPPSTSGTAYRVFDNVGFELQPWFLAFLAVQLCSMKEAVVNYAIFNFYPFSWMSLERIIQLADSADPAANSTQEPYELAVLARREKFYKKQTTTSIAATTQLLNSVSLSSFTDQQVSDKLNFILQFKDGETEQGFLVNFFGKLTRYKVGAIIACVFSGGIAIISALSYIQNDNVSVLETLGWSVFFLVSISLVVIFFTQSPERLRPIIHRIMLVALLVAFSGMSIANFVASQSQPDTHPVTMGVSVFGLLVVVRPPLQQIIQYLTIAVTGLALWYQVFRVEEWEMGDIFLRVIEFVTVFIISLIGLVIGEKFDRKLYLMQLAIRKSVKIAEDAEQRSMVLLNNVLPSSIVAEMSNRRIKRNLTDFSVTLPAASVLQSDIVSFTAFSSSKRPHQVVEMLNSMFKKFDHHVNELGIEKIKTIGDAYVVASGIPCTDRYHAEKICCFGLRMLASIKELNDEGVPSIPVLNIAIRVGAACGPIKAGVIAMEKMRYELFGGTAEDCEKMEQTGKPGRVQVTKQLYAATKGSFNYDIIRDEEANKDRYFLREDSVEPYLRDMTTSQLVSTNNRKQLDRFRILEDEDPKRREMVKKQDPSIGGKLSRFTLEMKNDELEQEFRKYYSLLADDRTNVETAQSTILYALVASIVGLFVGTINNPVVILQLVVASLLGLATFLRMGIPFFRSLRRNLHRRWKIFEAQVVSGGLGDALDHDIHYSHEMSEVNNKNQRNRSRSTTSSNDLESSTPNSSFGNNNEAMVTRESSSASDYFYNNNNINNGGNTNDPLLEKQSRQGTGFSKIAEFLARPKAIVIAVGILTLADPLIVLGAISEKGISRGAVFITLAAASFVFSQMHLFFMQKIVLASIHFVLVSIAFFVRTAVLNDFNGKRDGGDYVGVLCCYVLCIGAAYTTERSVRKAFVAQKNVERRNAEIGTTLHLCEKLLGNSIPASIVRRLQEAPDRAVVDEIPEASVLFLYIDGVFPHGEEDAEERKKAKQLEEQKKRERRSAAQQNGGDFGDIPWADVEEDDDDEDFVDEIGTEAGAMTPSPTVHNSRLSQDSDDTPELVSRMNDVFYVLDALCRYHQVEKIKTLPYLVVSGCPEPIPKHCHRLACVARDAIAFAEAYNAKNAGKVGSNGKPIPPLRIKAGLHSGCVTAGILGTSKFVYDVFGDTVNLSSRLASNGQWGQVSCSDDARKFLALETVTVTERGEVFLKGKGNVPVYEVTQTSLRVDTPEFINDIDSYLATMTTTAAKSKKDRHTARWSMKSSSRGSADIASLRYGGGQSTASGTVPLQSAYHLKSASSGGRRKNNNNDDSTASQSSLRSGGGATPSSLPLPNTNNNNKSNNNNQHLTLNDYVFPTSARSSFTSTDGNSNKNNNNQHHLLGGGPSRLLMNDSSSISAASVTSSSVNNPIYNNILPKPSPPSATPAPVGGGMSNMTATNSGSSSITNGGQNSLRPPSLSSDVFVAQHTRSSSDPLFPTDTAVPSTTTKSAATRVKRIGSNASSSSNSSSSLSASKRKNNNVKINSADDIINDKSFQKFISSSPSSPAKKKSNDFETTSEEEDDDDDILFGPTKSKQQQKPTPPALSPEILAADANSTTTTTTSSRDTSVANESSPNNNNSPHSPLALPNARRKTLPPNSLSTSGVLPATALKNNDRAKIPNKTKTKDPLFDSSSSSSEDDDDDVLFGPSSSTNQNSNPMSENTLLGNGNLVPVAARQNPQYYSSTHQNTNNKKSSYDPLADSSDDDDRHVAHQRRAQQQYQNQKYNITSHNNSNNNNNESFGSVFSMNDSTRMTMEQLRQMGLNQNLNRSDLTTMTTPPTAVVSPHHQALSSSSKSNSNGNFNIMVTQPGRNTPQKVPIQNLPNSPINNNSDNNQNMIHSPTSPSVKVAKQVNNISIAIGNAPMASSSPLVKTSTSGMFSSSGDFSSSDDDLL